MSIQVYSDTPHVCPVCGAAMKTRQGLSGHCRFRHGGQGYASNYRPRAEVPPIWATRLINRLDEIYELVDSIETHLIPIIAKYSPELVPVLQLKLQSKSLKYIERTTKKLRG